MRLRHSQCDCECQIWALLFKASYPKIYCKAYRFTSVDYAFVIRSIRPSQFASYFDFVFKLKL